MDKIVRVVKIFKSFEEQEAADIRYYVGLTPEERIRISRELRERFFGADPPPIKRPGKAT
jgi:hypothetical protein